MNTNDIIQMVLLSLLLCLSVGWFMAIQRNRRLRSELQQHIDSQQHMQSFMASMSHHLRTPLNGIMGYAEYIHSSSKEPMIHFTSKIILENSLEMLHLVNGMLDINKIKQGQLQLSESEFDVYDLLESVHQLHQPRATRLNIALELSTDQQSTLMMRADPYRLRQVLNNLVDNAIAYNRPQGQVTLQLSHNEADQTLTFTVADTGLGVPHEVEKNLFTGLHDPSSHFAMKRKEGAGLGLVLSHQLVHLMGGQLDYRTEAGVGSSFFFTLPLRSAEKAAV
jgi:two-component system sensor histidine kinase TorS